MASARRRHIQAHIAQRVPAKPTVGLAAARQVAPPPKPKAQAPAAPVQTSMPWETDPLFAAGAGQALKGNQDRLSSIQSGLRFRQEQAGLGQYANNPYSEAALLSRQHQNQRRGTINSAGNLLYAGSTVNRLRGSDRDYDMGLHSLKTRLSAEEARAKSEERDADNSYQEALASLREDAVGRAIEETPAPAPVPAKPKQNKQQRRKGRK